MSKKSKSGEISQSVEESNATRAKLGIKPLREEADKSSKGTSNDPVHVPADAAKAAAPSAAEEKKRKAAAKTRRDHEELTTGEGLGDILAREEKGGKVGDWVSRTRNEDGSMKQVGSVAAGAKRKSTEAASSVPKMKVRHDAGDLREGEQVTMTLSDKSILDADGNIQDGPDELSNARMSDLEKAKHHDAIRNQKEYDPTKVGASMLDKYDEIKTGPSGFTIGGASVSIEETDPEKRLKILTEMSEKQSLESKLTLQKDYYTADEMAKFRKPPKKKTKRRKGTDAKDKEDQIGDSTQAENNNAVRPVDAGSDEEDPELYEQLSKQRRLVRRSDAGAMKKGEAALGAVSERIQAIPDQDDEEKEVVKKDDNKIAMTATTEFCNVVQTPLEKMETMKHESFRGSTLYKKQVTDRKGVAAGEKRARKAGLAGNVADVEDMPSKEQLEEDATWQEEGLDLSCASGLAYLRARDQIGGDQETHKNRKTDNRPLEMSTTDGDIKLEYRDDYGRVQTPKEAFRAISWKFHGKVPGRKNMERRLLRLENEMRLKSMDYETSLPTLRALKHVQHADAKPYMVLSGANEK